MDPGRRSLMDTGFILRARSFSVGWPRSERIALSEIASALFCRLRQFPIEYIVFDKTEWKCRCAPEFREELGDPFPGNSKDKDVPRPPLLHLVEVFL